MKNRLSRDGLQVYRDFNALIGFLTMSLDESTTPTSTGGDESELPTLINRVAGVAAENRGDVIGCYTLLDVLGEGGFGRVWLAEQSSPVRRKVALKILKPGMDTDEVLSRFRQERQSLALMDHPGIARVFDAGTTPSGRPFFTMEYVRGRAITQFCDARSLDVPARLRLFAKVCLAIQHAHQKGIIHRDIKPSNILVSEEDGEATPHIIDFGVAKALGREAGARSFATMLHQVVGTPSYMSPEQADGQGFDIDTRSDIYSLGVVLYEMLTGVLPVGGSEHGRASVHEVLQKVRQEVPSPPSRRITSLGADQAAAVARQRGVAIERLPSLLRGDLDWIVLKCLEKDRQRRYETVGALATDIRAHLENRPVVARPPSAGYLIGRAFRRNRVAFTLGGVAVLSLVAACAVSAFFFLSERDARLREQAQRERAEFAIEDQIKARHKEQEHREAAEASAIASRRTLSQSHFLQAVRLIERGENHPALLHLNRSLSVDPNNEPSACRLVHLITYGDFSRPVFSLPTADKSHRVAHFSADGKRFLATAGKKVFVTEVGTWRQVAETISHDKVVWNARFSADGECSVRMASG